MNASSNKVALVTGSTSGIGLACVRRFANRNINVILTGSRDKSLVADILDDLNRGGNIRADYVQADLSKSSDVAALWSEVVRLYPDGIDILVNNAALTTPSKNIQTVDDVLDETWNRMALVNLTVPFRLTKYCLPGMKRKGWGRIVNMSSTMGLISAVGSTAYATFKHGLIGLSKGVALENAAHGITCNAVCPGWTQTPMAEVYKQKLSDTFQLTAAEAEARLLTKIATGKLVEPDQVADLVELLCLSDASSQMTGASYLIDHGYTAA